MKKANLRDKNNSWMIDRQNQYNLLGEESIQASFKRSSILKKKFQKSRS
jgi:hypothetical protein